MNKKYLLLLIFLTLIIGIATDDDCTTNFQKEKEQICQELSGSTETCRYIDNECKSFPKECSSYNPANNKDFDDEICNGINLENKDLRKCHVILEGGIKKCEETDKECKDLSEATCFNLDLGSDKRCIFIDGKCEEHYYSCNGLDEPKCAKNIPFDYRRKCVYNGTNCNEEDRYCSDYIQYKYKSTYSIDTSQCSSMKHAEWKVCSLDENKICKELYQSCSNIKEQSNCHKNNTVYPGNNPTIDCLWENQKCNQKEKLCSEYKQGGNEIPCEKLHSQNSLYKHCYLNEETDTCEDVFTSCSEYESFIKYYSTPDTNLKIGCESVILKNKDKKCSYNTEKKTCKEVSRDCREYKTKDACNSHKPEDSNKRCIFKSTICIEDYKNCEAYNATVPKEEKNALDCENIVPDYYAIYKCVFENSSCIRQKMFCENYTGFDEEYCNSLSTNNSRYYCAMKDNKCISEYSDCFYYNQLKGKNKEECESIKLPNKNQYCVFRDNYCNTITKICSEYEGDDPKECETYRASGDGNLCSFINGSCVEINNYVFDSCSDYKGNDKKICSSIQPYSYINNEYGPDYSMKCAIDQFGFCDSIRKTCSEAKNENECLGIIPQSEDKMCIYKNSQCVERYKTCQLYQNSGEKIDKDICESIVIDGDYKNKCIFDNGSCKSQSKSCSDFNIELIMNKCYEHNPIINTKKCAFSNGACSTVDRATCLELYYSNDVTEDICKAADTSNSNTVCTLRIEYDQIRGCQEINIPVIATPKNENENNENSSKEKSLSKIALGLLWFLL